mmetsp:Transcript_8890/g.14785  ORF Transcript_8890/g.14785 Transcript_8890/m.14785 type:complete len:260 (-) Transcript_8890:258-1037(-)
MSNSAVFRWVLAVSIIACHFVRGMHESFNFILPPLKRQCFFETLTRTSPAHRVEAFVLSGGNLDVVLTFHGPLIENDIIKEYFEDPIFQETIDSYKEVSSETLTYTTEFKPEKPGTYAICLDNRMSRFMSKVVQLDIRAITAGGGEVANDEQAITVKLPEGGVNSPEKDIKEEVDAEKLKESLAALNAINQGLNKIQMQQRRDRHRLDLHSETNNKNYSSVFTGSIFETGVFIAVSIFQIYFVRRWFASRRPPGVKSWA